MKNIISEISGFLNPGTVVLDVCSVKLLPCEWMLEGLPDNIDIIATHPMFGPDSYGSGLNSDLQIMLYSLRSISNNSSYKLWCEFFISKKLNILEITPDEHTSKTTVPGFKKPEISEIIFFMPLIGTHKKTCCALLTPSCKFL